MLSKRPGNRKPKNLPKPIHAMGETKPAGNIKGLGRGE